MLRHLNCLLLALSTLLLGSATAEEPKKKENPDTVKADAVSAAKAAAKEAEDEDTPKAKPKYPAFSSVIKDATKLEGLITLHKKETSVYAEIPSSIQNKDLIMVMSIARGIGQQPLLGGMSWGFGDDWVWQFRKVDDTIRIVRRNVRFTANKGSPEDKAVGLAYTDSVLYSLPIATMSPGGAPVVDLTPVFMSDIPQLSQVLSGFVFSSNKSNWATVKSYPDNVELEVAATYASSGTQEIETIADSRGATIHVHYSISLLPNTGYKPRVADDRVGYFPECAQGLFHENRRRSLRPVHQSLGPAKG